MNSNTGKLAGEPVHSHEAIYEKELSKHDATCGYLRKNLAAQEQILAVLDEARLNNAHFYKRQREENQLYDDKINQLVLAAESSVSILDKLTRGCQFLTNLGAELTKISGVLQSALGSRNKMRAKMAPPPPRPSQPKPKKNSGLTDEMMKELEDLGMADDPEFIQFLLSNGEGMKDVMPTKLPGVPNPKIGVNRPQAPYQPPRSVAPAMSPHFRPATQVRPDQPPQRMQFRPRVSIPQQIPPQFQTPLPQGAQFQQPNPPIQVPKSPPVSPRTGPIPPQTSSSISQLAVPNSSPQVAPHIPSASIPQPNPLEAEFKRQQAMLEQERLKLKTEQDTILNQRAQAEQARLAQQQQFQIEQSRMMQQLAEERAKLEQQQKQFEQEKRKQQQQYQHQQEALKRAQHQSIRQPNPQVAPPTVQTPQPTIQPVRYQTPPPSLSQVSQSIPTGPRPNHRPLLPSQTLITQPTQAQNQPKMTTNIQQNTNPPVTSHNYSQMFSNIRPVMPTSSTQDWLSRYRQNPTQSFPQQNGKIAPVSVQQVRPNGQAAVQYRYPAAPSPALRTQTPPITPYNPTTLSAPQPTPQPPLQVSSQPPLQAPMQPTTLAPQPQNHPPKQKSPEPEKPKSNFDLLSR